MLNEILLQPINTEGRDKSSAPNGGISDGFRQESRALAHLAAVWTLRMMRRRPALFRSRAGFAHEHQVLALTGLPESLIGEQSNRRVVRTVRERLAKLESASVPLAGPLFDNATQSSARASCFALPPASMQSSARCFLALTKISLFLEAPIVNVKNMISGNENLFSYIASWLKVLQDDKRAIFAAAAHAQRAVDFLHRLQDCTADTAAA